MVIDSDIITFALGTIITVIGYVLHTARESIAALGKRLGDVEQSHAVNESKYEALMDVIKDMRESEKATAGVISDIYSMMNEIKVEMAKLSARSEERR